MSNQQYRGALTPDHRSDWLSGRPPAPVWTSALSCPSSGNARLLPVYAGALSATTSKLVYRKAKAGEHSYAKGTRWETLTGAAYVDQDAITAAGSNITAVGNATHLGLPCNYITWPAATHNDASSYCADGHGSTIAVGQTFSARLDLAFSRALTGDEVVDLRVTGATQTANRQFAAGDNLPAGQFHSVILNEGMVPGSAAGTNTVYYYLSGTFSSPLTIYFRRRMLFDASGLDASECVPDFIDPAVVYNAVAAGVKWLATKCGNTVAANGVIIPGTGAALPEPMGVQWQPAATGLATYSPPSTAAGTISFTNCAAATVPGGVSGLPAIRLTANGSGSLEHFVRISAVTVGARRTLTAIVQKPATINARACLLHGNTTFYCSVVVSSDWSTLDVREDTSGKIAWRGITPLGNNAFLIAMSVNTASESSQYDRLQILNASNVISYDASAGEYLDVAAFNAVAQPYAGTPMLASGGATSRLADDPATGLPAIGTGPFTAFVDVTILRAAIAGVEYANLFASENSGGGVAIHYTAGANVYFYKDNVTLVNGLTSITLMERTRLVFRRTSDGLVALFCNGVKKIEVSSTPYNSTTTPRFFGKSSLNALNLPDAIVHDQWLEYSALSDEDCIRVTRS